MEGWRQKELGMPGIVFTSEGDELVSTTEKRLDIDRPSHGRPMHSSRIICAYKGRLVMKKTLVTIEDGF
jgi:hypothetical protein